jgi:hypothetical protein
VEPSTAAVGPLTVLLWSIVLAGANPLVSGCRRGEATMRTVRAACWSRWLMARTVSDDLDWPGQAGQRAF